MQRVAAIITAIALVLSIWTGSAAHAAEKSECIPVTAEVAGHFDGDQDQAPDRDEKGVAHHHGGCSGHQVSGSMDTVSVAFADFTDEPVLIAANAVFRAGLPPDSQLRPPIA